MLCAVLARAPTCPVAAVSTGWVNAVASAIFEAGGALLPTQEPDPIVAGLAPGWVWLGCSTAGGCLGTRRHGEHARMRQRASATGVKASMPALQHEDRAAQKHLS